MRKMRHANEVLGISQGARGRKLQSRFDVQGELPDWRSFEAGDATVCLKEHWIEPIATDPWAFRSRREARLRRRDVQPCLPVADLRITLLVLAAFTLVVPTLNSLLDQSFVNLIWVTMPLFYYLCGYYLNYHVELGSRHMAIGVACLAIVLGATAYSIVARDDYANVLHAPTCPLIALYSIMVFLLFKRHFDIDASERKAVRALSEYSFCIYILHPLVLNILYKGIGWGPHAFDVPVLFEATTFAVAMLGAIACVWLLKRVPFFREIL